MVAPVTEAGMGVWLRNVIPFLENKHNVTLLTSRENNLEIKCKNIIRLDSWKFPNTLYRYMPKLKKLTKNEFFNNFDIVHLHGFSTYATDFILFNKSKIKPPIIISTHGNLQHQTKTKFIRKLHDILALQLKNRIDGIIAVSEEEKKQLVKIGFSESIIDVVYNGVEIAENLSKKHLQNSIVLYVGRLAPSKNLELLIEAFSLCRNKNVELIIAGKDFGSLNSLEKLAKENNIENKIKFLGYISDSKKFDIFSQARVFVHPSLSDVFSLTLLEAAGSGVPCIAFDVGGNSEIFDSNSGLLVRNKNKQSLADAIELLLNDDELALQFSKAGKKSILSKFSWKNTADGVLSVYCQTLKNFDHTRN